MPRPFRLLLIDDDPMDIELAMLALAEQQHPYEITAVQSGAAALVLLRGGLQPDLILLDLNMPGMHGLEVLSALKGDPRLQLMPVVIFTTSSRQQDVQRALGAQANGYLVKPTKLADQARLMTHLMRYWTQTLTPSWPDGGLLPGDDGPADAHHH